VSFQDTLCHELGHSLALDHTNIEEAIMFASTEHRDFERDLHPDDIAGVRFLYGQPNGIVSFKIEISSTKLRFTDNDKTK